MRLWTVHPQYLDTKGLLAAWREGLLAQKVLLGATKGYTNHPQLYRFKNHPEPLQAIGSFLTEIVIEATKRNYSFDKAKILYPQTTLKITETSGQLNYEWQHLLKKLASRSPQLFIEYKEILIPKQHPLFTLVTGDVQPWEIVS
ncbi:pyrimidine dimer DNA glycosylase/endonuclease V [Entomomonas asaccharolytica]|uniref:DNA lyase n=1 Tax=Entomomonas asaccharolytica TaxID=2785331 RepID=A0A974NHW3_9GAMM|nr:pyrimidine dimer DNA glycosylase/endonuclease V [Entomomonas asaccharolytica]QQP86769.1 DNA lyase [Entomomonas asaccharolytica]